MKTRMLVAGMLLLILLAGCALAAPSGISYKDPVAERGTMYEPLPNGDFETGFFDGWNFDAETNWRIVSPGIEGNYKAWSNISYPGRQMYTTVNLTGAEYLTFKFTQKPGSRIIVRLDDHGIWTTRWCVARLCYAVVPISGHDGYHKVGITGTKYSTVNVDRFILI